MTLPGFTADAALYKKNADYRLTAQFARPGGTVQPAACNLRCLDHCDSNCPDPSGCDELPTPAARAACVRHAVQCMIRCRQRCCHTQPF